MPDDFEFTIRLVVALVLGLAIGAEREASRHPAGLRTMAMVCCGSSLFTMLGTSFAQPGTDPTRIAAQIVTGVGFLGAGAILRQGVEVKGLTTAAAIWIVAAIGMASGFGRFGIAVIATALVLAALLLIRPLERMIFKRQGAPEPEPEREPLQPPLR